MVNGDAGMSLARPDHLDYAEPGATGAKDLIAACSCLLPRVFRRECLPIDPARRPLRMLPSWLIALVLALTRMTRWQVDRLAGRGWP